MKHANCSILLLAMCLAANCRPYYLPVLAPDCGLGPKDKCHQKVHLSVNHLDSVKSALPYNYEWFDFCGIDKTAAPSNLYQVVFGERIRNSVYNISFMQNETCKVACEKTYMGGQDNLKKILYAVKLNYLHHWIIDNMPVIWCYEAETAGENTQYCEPGHPIGCYVTAKGIRNDACVINDRMVQRDTYYLFNHVDITVEYRPVESSVLNGSQLVSIKVVPRSINHTYLVKSNRCDKSKGPLGISGKDKGQVKVTYTYSVYFKENKLTKWFYRWNNILHLLPGFVKVQWISIMSSLITIVFLSGLMAAVILRSVSKAIVRFNQSDHSKGVQGEFGWELIRGDVFRPPNKGMLLSAVIGSGTQILGTFVITLVFACLGLLSLANRGALGTCALVFYVVFGTSAGYTAARIYKTFGGEKWKSNFLLTALLVPGIIFGVFFINNLLLRSEQSSAAVPCGTIIVLLALWLCVSVPLTFIGAYFGFKCTPIEHPVPTNTIPRQIKISWTTHYLPGIIVGGFLPFGCIFIQVCFIFTSSWGHRTYNMFGYLLLTFVMCVITTSETTILLCYFQLCAEDYRWWWRSFITAGFSAFYIFLYSIYFFVSKLEFEEVSSIIIYFGYTILFVFIFFLAMAPVGFFSCFLFVTKMYSLTKLE